jgi:4-hydroxythreonine-4-phosphate dehydrogenase
MPQRPVLAITVGEPAGIGPEIALRAAWALRDKLSAVLIGDAAVLADLASSIDPAIRLEVVNMAALKKKVGATPDVLRVLDCPLPHAVQPGQLDPSNSPAVLRMLDTAITAAQQGQVEAIVTAPLQKSVMSAAGIPFTGHTEYLAEKTQARQVVMMLVGTVSTGAISFPLRVALATTHLPLKAVSEAITFESLLGTLRIVDHDLKRWFGLPAPRLLVAGLNPHAGESGYLGTEEIDVIAPAIAAAQAEGIDARGPYPADTLFQPPLLQQADGVVAMYHDQGLPVLKHASFGSAVNVTLGLPIIRTSVDHGTALDQAVKGVGHAKASSMVEALKLAAHMAERARA